MILLIVSLVSLGVMGICFGRAVRTLHQLANATKDADGRSFTDDMPTVSVCIPARNETHALSQCLERVLASRYPKLEILVLDDNSNDDTSILIKSFAHAGVRFIPGKPLPSGWLGKNHAYAVMAQEASADVLVFMDVDVSVDSLTFDRLMAVFMSRKLAMLSVIPYRRDRRRLSALFGTLRYVWEVILASKKRPASASALWMIARDTLNDIGLEAFSSSVKPEAHLAKRVQAQGQYQALVGNSLLEVGFEKRYLSQIETAERVYFPLFGHTYLAAIAGFLLMALLAFPVIGVVLAVLVATPQLMPIITITNLINLLLGVALLVVFEQTAQPRGVPFGALLWPWRIAQDACIIVISIIKYATHRVTWKGRNVSAPTHNTGHFVIDE